jgi:hypothetical protein
MTVALGDIASKGGVQGEKEEREKERKREMLKDLYINYLF